MKSIAFFDFTATLLRSTKQGWKVCRESVERLIDLGETHRIGLLCNLPPGHDEESLRLLLRIHGLEAWIDPALFIIANHLPTPLPDPRAFAVAAALAEAPAASLRYVSANETNRAAAKAAGWKVEEPPTTPGNAALLAERAGLLAEVDEDASPTYILKGRIVTMEAQGTVIPDGRILVRKSKIVALLKPQDPLPADFSAITVVDTKSTLYPGMLDLHNHLAYNVLSLWDVPKKYDNRAKWQKNPDYPKNISAPARALAGNEETAKAAARYVEAKALVGGCTTSQGMMMIEKGIVKYFKGLMRNVERTGDPRLAEAATRVPDIIPTRASDVSSFRKNLEKNTALFYHLSEGTDTAARQRFQDLVDNDLLGKPLVGIHSLALAKADLDQLSAVGAKIVWSPYSNLLLYGQTLNLTDVLSSGVTVALGCDWAPSGSRNPLLELKVAKWCIDQQGVAISDFELVKMVTSTPAAILGWDKFLGILKPKAFLDLVAIEGTAGDPYAKLINARERDVSLVCIHGMPRYGESTLMGKLMPGTTLESATIDGVERKFHFQHPQSLINNVTLSAAQDILLNAMADLPQFVKDSGQEKPGLLADGLALADQFGLVLDMDAHEDDADESGLEAATLLAQIDPNKIAMSVDLDPLATDDPLYWSIVEKEKNLPPLLKTFLKQAYA